MEIKKIVLFVGTQKPLLNNMVKSLSVNGKKFIKKLCKSAKPIVPYLPFMLDICKVFLETQNS